MSNREVSFFSKEKLFYGVALVLIIGALIALIQEGDLFSTRGLILLGLLLVALIAAGALITYDRIVENRATKKLWRDRLGIVRVFPN